MSTQQINRRTWIFIIYGLDPLLMIVTMRHLCLHYAENLGLNMKECLKTHNNAPFILDKWNGKEKASNLFLSTIALPLQTIQAREIFFIFT